VGDSYLVFVVLCMQQSFGLFRCRFESEPGFIVGQGWALDTGIQQPLPDGVDRGVCRLEGFDHLLGRPVLAEVWGRAGGCLAVLLNSMRWIWKSMIDIHLRMGNVHEELIASVKISLREAYAHWQSGVFRDTAGFDPS
jgi:hypothetical protein